MSTGNSETFEYRGLTVTMWRTDDPMEPPADDLDAEGPFEIGDFYGAIAEWGLQTGASMPTASRVEKFVKTAIDAVVEVGMIPSAALRIGDIEAITCEPQTTSTHTLR